MLDDIGDCVFNGFAIKATPKTNYLLPEYCAFCFATEDFRKYVTSHCAFTTRASLTGKAIAEYQLAIPSIKNGRKKKKTCPLDFRQKSKLVRSSMNITGISCYPLKNYQSKEARMCRTLIL